MKIGEVAGRAGVSVDTVRFYERVGVLPAPPARPPATATTSPRRSTASTSHASSRRSASRSTRRSARSPPTTPAAPPASPSSGASRPCSTAWTASSPSSPHCAAASCRHSRTAPAAAAASRAVEPSAACQTHPKTSRRDRTPGGNRVENLRHAVISRLDPNVTQIASRSASKGGFRRRIRGNGVSVPRNASRRCISRIGFDRRLDRSTKRALDHRGGTAGSASSAAPVGDRRHPDPGHQGRADGRRLIRAGATFTARRSPSQHARVLVRRRIAPPRRLRPTARPCRRLEGLEWSARPQRLRARPPRQRGRRGKGA